MSYEIKIYSEKLLNLDEEYKFKIIGSLCTTYKAYEEITHLLKMDFTNYQQILRQYGGHGNYVFGYWFSNRKDVEKFVNEVIEPRLLMKQLTEV